MSKKHEKKQISRKKWRIFTGKINFIDINRFLCLNLHSFASLYSPLWFSGISFSKQKQMLLLFGHRLASHPTRGCFQVFMEGLSLHTHQECFCKIRATPLMSGTCDDEGGSRSTLSLLSTAKMLDISSHQRLFPSLHGRPQPPHTSGMLLQD